MQNENFQYNKYIFVHIPRTGGTFAMNHLFNNGFQIYCPWSNDLMRDWTRSELLMLIEENQEAMQNALHKYSDQIHPDLQRRDKIIHSHSIAFDYDLIFYAKSFGWKVFTIIRDTTYQLQSIFARFYYQSGMGINEFVEYALGLSETNMWFIPYWCMEFEFILDNNILQGLNGLPQQLNRRFNCHNHGFESWQYTGAMDESLRRIISNEMTNVSRAKILQSSYHQRYLQCVKRSLKYV